MNWLRQFGVGLAVLVIQAATAAAQDVPALDLNVIPTALRHTPLPDCGISIAADPVWPRTVEQERDRSGNPMTTYSFTLGPEFWHERLVLPLKVYINPQLKVTVTCMDTTLRGSDGLARFAQKMHENARGTLKNVSALKSAEAQGLGSVTFFTSESHGAKPESRGRIADQGHFQALHRDRLISVRVRISRKPSSIYRKRLRAGARVQFERENGQPPIVFLVKDAARQAPAGSVSYLRSKAENKALIETLRRSLRGG